VTHERSGLGERKKLRAGRDVWLSSRSANHVSQSFHTWVNPPSQLMRW